MSKNKDKVYVLGMFPYPSGDGLHVGHVRIYTAVDVMARYFRMAGREGSELSGSSEPRVLCPIGWDAFGLPAENAAIKAKTNPSKIVPKNYANFRKQMQNLSFNFDWERELATTDPTYYGLTQWIFLELYKKGLVYREQVPINWCPKCKTGLANEEVLPDGTHERCGTATGKKELPQWVMKITAYAERLLNDLRSGGVNTNELDWPRGILEMQRNWIGKKEGARLQFTINNLQFTNKIEVFTTRLDTIEGVTFVVIAPEMAQEWIDAGWQPSEEVKRYVKESMGKTEQARLEGEKNKTGVKTGIVAVNPHNGEEVPVWVADYVLADVGTGAVMGVPFYDERDREFADKMGLSIKEIELISKERIFAELEKKGVVEKETTYHLRDWVFSRQRYWGEPIPLVYCAHCAQEDDSKQDNSEKSALQIVQQDGRRVAVVPLPEKDLPLTLPELQSYEPTDTGESPLSRVEVWVKTECPKCGGEARRETDTMPNWAGSCWYHLAFAFWRGEQGKGSELPESSEPIRSTKSVLDEYKSKSQTPFTDFWREVARPEIDKWLPVDWYLGGAEHAVLHLLYARFWNKVLYDLGHLSFPEPYLRLRSVGMVLAEDGRKMSKSWGNVINPDDVAQKFGSDAVRLYEMFMGPWDQAIAWDSRALIGMKRFLERVVEKFSKERNLAEKTSPELAAQLAKLIKQVEAGIVEQKFNTCIAGMMELTNMWRNDSLVMSTQDAQKFAQIMSPFAPKTAQSIWQMAGGEGKAEETKWPSLDVAEVEVPVTIAVQVNGRLRATVMVDGQWARDQEEVLELVMKSEQVKKWIPESGAKKVIFVPGRLVNLVV